MFNFFGGIGTTMRRKLFVALQREVSIIASRDTPMGLSESLNRQPHSGQPKLHNPIPQSIPACVSWMRR